MVRMLNTLKWGIKQLDEVIDLLALGKTNLIFFYFNLHNLVLATVDKSLSIISFFYGGNIYSNVSIIIRNQFEYYLFILFCFIQMRSVDRIWWHLLTLVIIVSI